jgi:hypothetical protein
MYKGISLTGPYNQYGPQFGVQPYVASSGTQFISLWIVWPSVDPAGTAPTSIGNAWARWNAAPGSALGVPPTNLNTALRTLDQQVILANQNSKSVIVTCYHTFPSYTNQRLATDPSQAQLGFRELSQRYPHDQDADSPWAWWVGYLCARYAIAPANPYGPHLTAYSGENASGYTISLGNPSGAFAQFIQMMNEPNYQWYPQQSAGAGWGPDIACVITTMAQSADAIAAFVKAAQPFAPNLLMPGLADVGTSVNSPIMQTNYNDVAGQAAGVLNNWSPASGYVGWAHHFYSDVKEGPLNNGQYRFEKLIGTLQANSWGGSKKGAVYLTEGGYHFDVSSGPPYTVTNQANQTKVQAAGLKYVYARARTNTSALKPGVLLQYFINDSNQSKFQSSLRGPIVNGQPNPSPYPVYQAWGNPSSSGDFPPG